MAKVHDTLVNVKINRLKYCVYWNKNFIGFTISQNTVFKPKYFVFKKCIIFKKYLGKPAA